MYVQYYMHNIYVKHYALRALLQEGDRIGKLKILVGDNPEEDLHPPPGFLT